MAFKRGYKVRAEVSRARVTIDYFRLVHCPVSSFQPACQIISDLNSMDQLSGWRVADKLEKRSLLIAINCVAALSIFFFVSARHMTSMVSEAVY